MIKFFQWIIKHIILTNIYSDFQAIGQKKNEKRKCHLLTMIILIIVIEVIALLIVCVFKHQKQPMNHNIISKAGTNTNDKDVLRNVNDANEYQFNGQ